MTWKRVIIFVVALIWIVICAVSVFASELVAQTHIAQAQDRGNTVPSLTVSRFDLERLPANVFDEMHLTDILSLTDNTEIFAFAADSTHTTLRPRTIAANADFMQEVLPCEQMRCSQQNANTNFSINTTANTASTVMPETIVPTTVPKRPRSPQSASSPPSFASAKRPSSKSTPK